MSADRFIWADGAIGGTLHAIVDPQIATEQEAFCERPRVSGSGVVRTAARWRPSRSARPASWRRAGWSTRLSPASGGWRPRQTMAKKTKESISMTDKQEENQVQTAIRVPESWLQRV